eukprot:Platyproteum_vivax@DN13543_c0_g1_i1.p3
MFAAKFGKRANVLYGKKPDFLRMYKEMCNIFCQTCEESLEILKFGLAWKKTDILSMCTLLNDMRLFQPDSKGVLCANGAAISFTLYAALVEKLAAIHAQKI